MGKGLWFGNCTWFPTIILDPAYDMVIKKASQLGLTEFAIITLFVLAKIGMSGLYVLPTDNFRNDFMRERFNPTLQANQYYNDNTAGGSRFADAMSVKTIFEVPWKFVGARNRNNFFGFPASVILADEYDRCDQDNLAYAQDRLGRADTTYYYRFGNPSLPQHGIDTEYELSDKKEWQVKCPHCNHWQHLTWWQNIVRQIGEREYELIDPDYADNKLDPATIDFSNKVIDARTYCAAPGCERTVDRLSVGEWVQWYPKRLISGYAVDRIFGDGRDRAVLLELYFGRKGFLQSLDNYSDLQRFYNNVLGETFTPPGSAMSDEVIEGCVGEGDLAYRMPSIPSGKDKDCVAGMDIGGDHYLHISEIGEDGIRKKVFIGRVNSFREAAFICSKYPIAYGVVDARPESESSRDFCQDNSGWYMCDYPGQHNIKGRFKVDHREKFIKADRTQSLDASYFDYAQKLVLLPSDYRSLDNGNFVKQMQAPRRILDKKRDVYVWDEGSKPDHHRHADNYEKMAASLFMGAGPIVEVT